MQKTTIAHHRAHDDKDPTEAVTNRRFVQMVRAKLDAAGHHDIAVSRQWIDEDTPDHTFLLNVPLGTDLVVPLRPRDPFFRTEDAANIVSHVEHFARALITLRQSERMLVKYASDVRRAASKAIATARAEGLDVLLADVGFKPTYAWHLAGGSWKDSALHILASVSVRHTSFYLQPTISKVHVEEPGHAAKELQSIFDDQFERQGRLYYLEGMGVDLFVDAITMDLIRMHVSDVGQVLREVWRKQHVSIPVQFEGKETSLSLITSNGRVESSIEFEDAYWSGEHAWLLGENIEDGLDLVGKTLAGKVRHPALANRTVVHIERCPPEVGRQDVYHLDMAETFLFDADSGLIRPLKRRIAA